MAKLDRIVVIGSLLGIAAFGDSKPMSAKTDDGKNKQPVPEAVQQATSQRIWTQEILPAAQRNQQAKDGKAAPERR